MNYFVPHMWSPCMPIFILWYLPYVRVEAHKNSNIFRRTEQNVTQATHKPFFKYGAARVKIETKYLNLLFKYFSISKNLDHYNLYFKMNNKILKILLLLLVIDQLDSRFLFQKCWEFTELSHHVIKEDNLHIIWKLQLLFSSGSALKETSLRGRSAL